MTRHLGRTLAATTATVLTLAPTALGADRIDVRDACDPATFDLALGEGACDRSTDSSSRRVTFDRLLQAFPQGHDAWRFSGPITVRRGQSVPVVFDRGGELHSVTEVDQLGAGCVPDINALMGLEGAPVADCGAVFSDADQLISPSSRRTTLTGLSRGKHLLMCVVHPWMHTTVTVR